MHMLRLPEHPLQLRIRSIADHHHLPGPTPAEQGETQLHRLRKIPGLIGGGQTVERLLELCAVLREGEFE